MNESFVSVPVPTSIFLDLVGFLKESGSDRDPVKTVEDAIDYWMDNAEWKKEDLMPEAVKGYQWKQVYLPHKTYIRMKYKGEFYYAQVDGDNILYKGTNVSPGEFANTVTNSSRNAWRDVEIKRPNDDEWYLADSLRT